MYLTIKKDSNIDKNVCGLTVDKNGYAVLHKIKNRLYFYN